MKLRILLVALFLLGTINIAQAQVSDYDTKIETAVAAGNYDKAAALKEKKAIQKKIDAAVKAGDYDKANELKQQLNGEAVSKTKPVITAPKEAPSVEQKSAPIVKEKRKSQLLKNGTNIELLVGLLHEVNELDPSFGVSFRIGNTWYFGSGDVWRPGIRVNFIRLGLYSGTGLGEYNSLTNSYYEDKAVYFLVAPINVGFANVIDFGNNIGLELNLNIGTSFIYKSSDYYDDGYLGFQVNPEIKFRAGKFAVGLDYDFGKLKNTSFDVYDEDTSYYRYGETLNMNVLSLSIGAKF